MYFENITSKLHSLY